MKFNYFEVRGKGEITRLILAFADLKYDDNRIAKSDWPALKSKAPLAQLPYLELEDSNVQLAQSLAIARYLAREHGLAGSDNLEAAMIDAVVDTAADANNELLFIIYVMQGAAKEQAMEKFMNETIPSVVERLEKLQSMYAKEDGYMVGVELSWADLYISDFLENLEMFDKAIMQKHPKLANVRRKVLSHPKISAYIAKRK